MFNRVSSRVLIDANMERVEKSGALARRLEDHRVRLRLNERKRNERRLRELRRAYLDSRRYDLPSHPAQAKDDAVIEFAPPGNSTPRVATG